MSFFDVFGRDAVFPPPEDVALGTDYGELGNNQSGTLTFQGSGTEVVTVTVNNPNTNDVVENASVWITSDIAGNTLVTPYQLTNASGQATFTVNPGTYYLWAIKETVPFANIPQQITVTDEP